MGHSVRGRGAAAAALVLSIIGLAFVGVAGQATTIYVDVKAPGPTHDGTSWTAAYTDLQTALGAAISGDDIYVAEGIYTPGTQTSSSFGLKDGVALYGGYPTGGGARDVTANVTVLSGDVDDNDTTTVGIDTSLADVVGSNAYHVVTSSGNDGTAVLDGFTITGGYANGTISPDNAGGGMYTDHSSPTVTDCTFVGNFATYSSGGSGGGMANEWGSPQVTHCAFIGNGAINGGGMYNDYNASPQVTACTFSDNHAGFGGGMCNADSYAEIKNCTFYGNNAATSGGGMFNQDFSPTVTNCTFSNNTAYTGGGMGNYYSSPKIYDTILWGDSASGGGDEIHDDSSTSTASDCVVEGGFAKGTNIITADPLLGNLGNYNAGTSGTTETIPLLPGSSAIDAGNSATATATDQRGVSRDSTPDIGAFESRGFTLSVSSGTPQTTSINTAFAGALAVNVTSSREEPVMGGAVTFTAPTSGASATFNANPVTIGSEGTVSVTATANGVGGSYTVDAAARGASAVSFSLTNVSAEMAVKGNSHVIASGDTTPTTTDGSAFGSADIVTGVVDHAFSIASTGNVPLTLSGTPKVAITGTDAADFAVTVQPSSSLAANNGTTTFTIEFDPRAAGTRTATVSIANNSGTSPYTFAISGTGSVGAGDLNGDGVIDILDVRLCLQLAEGVIQGTAAQRQLADMNGDGQVTLADAQLLAQYVMTH